MFMGWTAKANVWHCRLHTAYYLLSYFKNTGALPLDLRETAFGVSNLRSEVFGVIWVLGVYTLTEKNG